ncbi:MAG: hypothetical protein A3H32_09580 [Betaproteobacteria bacterium RIFCSPLOWO2_02_FULL_63_19]|nr:MAG: hypothetical protein A3H32_09580 [Betaproteobacteria bacterium RIFCSPLOWO2_02_FULL_63_19]
MTLGIVFALLGALSFAMNSASVRRAVTLGAVSQGLYLTIFSGTGLFLIAALVSGQIFEAETVAGSEFAFMAASGIVHILGGRYCSYRAVRAIGANRTQPIAGLSVLVSVGIAILWLKEELDLLKATGIVLVLIGPALVAPKQRAAKKNAPAASDNPASAAAGALFTPNAAEGYFFGIAAAALWGAGPVLMRAGVGSNGLGMLGGTVAYAAASAILLVTLLIPGQASGAMTLSRSARGMFLVAGVSSWLANMFRFAALALAPVSIVIPLMRSSVLFSLATNFIFNRHLESFEPRVLGGIFVSLAGAILLVI